MRTVKVAEHAGFCFGVKRAVERVEELAAERVYTLGTIIHNEFVVKDLEEKGVRVLESVEDAEKIGSGIIVIRSHGVGRDVDERLRQISENSGLNSDGSRKITIVDATCPFVKKIHKIVSKASEEGKFVVMIGDSTHPEVCGILGWITGDYLITDDKAVLENYEFPTGRDICMVVQTTFYYKKFQEFVEIIEKKGYDINTSVVNTVCNATEERQTEATELASASDAMIIIGGMHSSNTRKLYEISSGCCPNTFFVQSAKDLDDLDLSKFERIGITAGASTPHNIIEEVQNRMEDFGQLLAEENLKSIHNGEVVEGTVLDVKEDQIILNIGYKADGIIPKSEYTKDSSLDLRTVVNVGDTMSAKVLKVNDGDGQVSLSYRRAQSLVVESKVLEEAFENKAVVTGKVVDVVKGGLNVLVDNVRVFIPASLVSDVFERDLNKYKDTDIEFYVTEYNPKKRRIIGDRKQLVASQKAEKMAAALANIREGDVFDGIVKNITDFGAFIDIGDIDGLLHVTEMGWGRTGNPKKVFKVGETVRCYVKEIKGDKIALSKKFDDENPWADAEEKFAVGNIVKGKVARMTAFGAFVELAPGVDGLLHVSQISRKRVEKPEDVLTVGQEIEAKVVNFDPVERKISLSMKAIAPEEDVEEEAPAAEEAATEEVAATEEAATEEAAPATEE